MNEVTTVKESIRQEVALRSVRFAGESAHGKLMLDLMVCRHIAATEAYRKASQVVFYVSDGVEPDLRTLLFDALRAGKSVYLPRYHADKKVYEVARVRDPEQDLVLGKFGFPEPAAHADLLDNAAPGRTLMLLPGVAFDVFGRRLGRGRGFYDRMLDTYGVTALGVFFEYRRFERLPDEAHDRHLDLVVTEAGAMYF